MPEDLDPKVYMTTDELAQLAGVSVPTANRWLKGGAFPNAVKGGTARRHGGKWFIPRADVTPEKLAELNPPNPDPALYMTVEELAEEKGVLGKTVRRWLLELKLFPGAIPLKAWGLGQQWYIPREEAMTANYPTTTGPKSDLPDAATIAALYVQHPDALDERQWTVILRLSGAHDGRRWTLVEVGREIGLLRQSVHVIKQGALDTLEDLNLLPSDDDE